MNLNDNINDLIKAVKLAWLPPPKLTLSQWADSNAFLSSESSAEPGKWHTLPYQKGIMDAFTDPEIERITVMKSARVGYTKIINNAIAYHIHHDPCPIMVVQPTIEDAEGYSKEEIAPMIRDTPALNGLVADPASKKSNNTILQKNFPGGTLSMVGANSPRGFRRVSRRIVLFDEVDGYPASAGAEGDQIKLGIKRTEYYWNRKIMAGSTPTIKDISRIERMYEESDQRRFFVPCPHCGEFQYLKWGERDSKFGIKWNEGDPNSAYYLCEVNQCIIEHKDKRNMIEKGKWQSTAIGKPNHAGFHIWAAYSYSPNATWAHLVSEFLDAKSKPEELKTFVNTALGETWEEEYSAKVGAEILQERCEDYNILTIPKGGLLLTAGIDVQDNRIAIVVRAWGFDEESWLINYTEIQGDPANYFIWGQVDELLLQDYYNFEGKVFKIKAVSVDSGGHYTHEVYHFCRTRKDRNVLAVKGSSIAGKAAISKPTKQDVNFKNQVTKRGVDLWLIGTDTIKAVIYGRLKSTNEKGPGIYHFPAGLPNEYFKQLTAEKQVTRYKNGHATRIWVKKNTVRNEALDCEVYAYAALQYIYTRTNRTTIWQQLQALIDKQPSAKISEEVPPIDKPTTNRRNINPKKSRGFVKGW
jgi:terminase, large subunit